MGEVGGFGTRPYGLSVVMVDFWDNPVWGLGYSSPPNHNKEQTLDRSHDLRSDCIPATCPRRVRKGLPSRGVRKSKPPSRFGKGVWGLGFFLNHQTTQPRMM